MLRKVKGTGEQVSTDNDQDLLQNKILVQGYDNNGKFADEKGSYLHVESMGKFEELHSGRKGSVE